MVTNVGVLLETCWKQSAMEESSVSNTIRVSDCAIAHLVRKYTQESPYLLRKTLEQRIANEVGYSTRHVARRVKSSSVQNLLKEINRLSDKMNVIMPVDTTYLITADCLEDAAIWEREIARQREIDNYMRNIGNLLLQVPPHMNMLHKIL